MHICREPCLVCAVVARAVTEDTNGEGRWPGRGPRTGCHRVVMVLSAREGIVTVVFILVWDGCCREGGYP